MLALGPAAIMPAEMKEVCGAVERRWARATRSTDPEWKEPSGCWRHGYYWRPTFQNLWGFKL